MTDRIPHMNSAGYSPGDFFPLTSFEPANLGGSRSTSSTSFANVSDWGEISIEWDKIVPSAATGAVAMGANIQPGTDETYTLRARNATDNETMVTQDYTSEEDPGWVDWETYTPTSNNIKMRVQHKTDPGSNSSTVYFPNVYIEVQL